MDLTSVSLAWTYCCCYFRLSVSNRFLLSATIFLVCQLFVCSVTSGDVRPEVEITDGIQPNDYHRAVGRSPRDAPSSSGLPRSTVPLRNCSAGGGGGGGGCSRGEISGGMDAIREQRVNAIKEQILKKLRMNSAPNVTINGRELSSMSRLFEFSDSEGAASDGVGVDEDLSTPVVMIIQSRQVPAPGFNNSQACFFKFPSDLGDGSQVIEAHLGVHLRRDPSLVRNPRELRLLVKKNVRRGSRTEVVRRKRIQIGSSDQWHYFDVKLLVQSWINEPNNNLGLTIVTSETSSQSLLIVQPRNSDEQTMRPFIQIRVKPSGVTRQPRSTGTVCNEDSQEQRCCRYPLIIDFEAFRWDWIMVPKRYEAFYCSGKCNFLFYQSPSRTAVQTQISSSMGDPCCAPTQVSPLSIIYYDEKLPGVVHSSIPGMVVKQCGCQ